MNLPQRYVQDLTCHPGIYVHDDRHPFVLVLGLKDELLEDVVIPCDDAADSTPISTPENNPGV
jgi:hypothetical protein